MRLSQFALVRLRGGCVRCSQLSRLYWLPLLGEGCAAFASTSKHAFTPLSV